MEHTPAYRIACGLWLLGLLMGLPGGSAARAAAVPESTVSAAPEGHGANPGPLDAAAAEEALLHADHAWLDGSPGVAAEQYTKLLAAWPAELQAFRATLILRLARAAWAADDAAGCLKALELLGGMEYVPEHHALAATELRAVAAGRPHPGLRRTPIPPIGAVRVTFEVGPGAPHATLHDAVAAAREARRTPGAGALEIVLAPGTHPITRTVALTREDAGSADAPLVIRSKDPRHPAVLTGGVTLTAWHEVRDSALLERLPESARGRARVCDLSAHGIPAMDALAFGGFSSVRATGGSHRFGTFPVPELFHRGEPQTMARWPDEGFAVIPVDTVPQQEADRYRRWAREPNLWLYGYWHYDWADAYEKIASIDDEGRIRLEPPTNRYGFGLNQGRAVNALCELDQVGEWYLDVAGNRVVYLPPDDFDPQHCVLSVHGTVIDAEACAHLQFRDLAIRFVRGDALRLTDCSDLTIAGLDIRYASGTGLVLHGGARHLVHSCRIESMGRGGMDILSGDWQRLEPGHSVVENCRISNLSRIDRTYTPALLLEGMGLKVRHNAFIDIPSSAIRLETCDALVELNYFRRCVYESGDQGAIDMWANPLYRGNIIRWNDFDSTINAHRHLGAAAVRLDDFISGFMITGNVMRRSAPHGFGAVQFNGGTDTYVEGNLMVDWHAAFSGMGQVLHGDAWQRAITTHERPKRLLEETDWTSDAWQRKYFMLRDLMNGDDNHNYLVGNVQLGSGQWGGVQRAILLANRRGPENVHGETLEELAPHVVPWYPIPLDAIGPYDPEAEPR